MKRISRFMPLLAGGLVLGNCTVSPAQLFTDAILAGIGDTIASVLSSLLLSSLGTVT